MLALTRETERQRAAFWPASVAVHDAASTCHVAWDPGPLRKGSRPPMFCGRVRLARVRYTSANGHAEQRRQSCGASEQGGCGMNVGRSRQPVQIPPASSDPTGRFRSHRPVQIPPAGSDPTARFRSHRPVQIPPPGSDPAGRFRSRQLSRSTPALSRRWMRCTSVQLWATARL